MTKKLTLDSIANDTGLNVFDLVQGMIARRINPTRALSTEQEREVFQLVSDTYGLSTSDKAGLWKLLNSEKGKQMIKRLSPFYGAIESKKFVSALSELIISTFGSEIRGINPDIDKVIIERTIFNLGPKRFLSIATSSKEDLASPNSDLLKADPNLFYSIVQKQLRHTIETSVLGYDELLRDLEEQSDSLRKDVIKNLSNIDSKERKSLESMINSTFDSLDRDSKSVVSFKRELDLSSTNGLQPKWHQALRIHHLTKRGHDGDYSMKRAIIADCTAAGKTFSLIASYGILKRDYINSGRKEGLKALIVSPKQAIHSVWGNLVDREEGTREWDINKYMRALGLPNLNLLRIDSLDDLEKIDRSDVDVVLINYEKLALSSSLDQVEVSKESGEFNSDLEETGRDIEQSGRYLEGLIERIDNFSTIIVDEGHNLKNTRSKRSGSMVDIIERTKDKHFWISTATTIPNRTKDAGFLLYMFDPKKFEHYKDQVFDIREDRFSIPNMVNSDGWFRLNIGDLQKVFNLGPLPRSLSVNDPKSLESKLYSTLKKRGISIPDDEVPLIYDMDQRVAEEYYKVWRNMDSQSISELPQVLLKGSIPYLTGLVGKLFEENGTPRVTLFTRHKKCFIDDMVESLVKSGISREQIGTINGDESTESRERMARAYERGDVRVMLCSSQISESFSLTCGDSKNYLVFAEPPFVPGVYEQAVGRGYRTGQNGEVITIHPIPSSSWLEGKMLEYKQEQEVNNPDMKVRKSFTPTNIFEDSWTSRLEKRQRNELGMKLSGDLSILDSSDTEDESEIYTFHGLDIHRKIREDNLENQIRIFTRGFQSARAFQGLPVERLVAGCDPLKRAYLLGKLMEAELGGHAFPPKRIAGAIQQVIDVVEKGYSENDNRRMNILDVGCGTAVLARQLKRPIISLDIDEDMIDGGKQFLLEERKDFGIESYSSTGNVEIDMKNVSKLLGKLDKSNLLLKSNARSMPLEDNSIDFISCAYAIMYNQQDFEERQVEEIFMEFNRVLKQGGYGLLTLPGETTREQHKQLYENMMGNYGFKVVFANYIADSVLAKKGRGAYSILFEKEGQKSKLHDWGKDYPEILYFRECLVGGRAIDRRKNTCFELNPRTTEGSDDYLVCERASQKGGKRVLRVLGSLKDHIYDRLNRNN